MEDARGRFIAVNAALARALRRSPDEIIGKTDDDRFPADLAAKYRADDQAVMDTRTSRRLEEWLVDTRPRIRRRDDQDADRRRGRPRRRRP